ncbi:uncharacterized protein LOC143123050 [Alosa pseudoharengus]|uniref:uncharacterized protein LOC143123050 n=1 Tax=Alosa pseudoharengus TaxID=34774 RepID=UPI003F89C110
MDEFVKGKLITEWQLPELIDTFADEAIDQESFQLLDEATIAALVPRVGLRLKFKKKFREFVTNSAVLTAARAPLTEDPHNSAVNEETVNSLRLVFEVIPVFDIRPIMAATSDGRAILTNLGHTGQLLTKERRCLVRILVSHLIETFIETPSTNTKIALANSLIQTFPCLRDSSDTGRNSWFAKGRKAMPSTGFLEERLRNIRKHTTHTCTHTHTNVRLNCVAGRLLYYNEINLTKCIV